MTMRRLACLTYLLLVGAGTVHAQAPDELRVKAAFVYNFTQFITWPAAPAPGESPVIVGILGSDAMRPAIEEILRTKEQKSRRYEVRVFGNPDEVRNCRILFIDLPRPRVAQVLKVLPHIGLLTIGVGEEFARQGGIISLVMDGNRVKFDLNLAAAERDSLKVDPTLLKLARVAGRW